MSGIMDLYTVKDLQKKSRSFSKQEIESFTERMTEGLRSGRTYDLFFCHPGLDAPFLCTLEHEFREKGFSFLTTVVSKKQDDLLNGNIKKILSRCQSMIITDLQQKKYTWQNYFQIGYFTCLKNRIAVLPVLKKDINTDRYAGDGICARYPYVGTGVVFLENRETLWVLKNPDHYVDFEHWLVSDPEYIDW